MGRRWSSPGRARARRGSSSSASPGCSQPSRTSSPEQLLVLTYNVKAARELRERIEQAVGAATAARVTVANFHSFCHRVLTESGPEVGLPARPDVLDGIGQFLLIRDIRPSLTLVYHSGEWFYGDLVRFINRAKDELVTPDDFDAFVAREREVFEDRYGSYANAAARLLIQGNLRPVRDVRSVYARIRGKERAEAMGQEVEYDLADVTKAADREARRTVHGSGKAASRKDFTPEQLTQIDELADTYVADGAALEVMRWSEIAQVYRAYQEELNRRGALDFGEQIAAVTQLFKARPNILRRWQRQFRYLLVDEFQDANIAQIELIELLGRTPDRPDNVMVVGDDDQSIYRFRGASFAAFAEFDRRFSRPPTHAPDGPPPGKPPVLRIEENFRSVGQVLAAANRLIVHNTTRFEPDKRLRTSREDGSQVEIVICGGAEDEAVAIVDAMQAHHDAGTPWSEMAVLYRKHKHREAIVSRLQEEDIPYTVVGGLSLFATPEIRDLEQGLRAIADPHDDVALTRMMTAGPWRLDALEILHVSRTARFDKSHLVDMIQQIVTAAEAGADAGTEPTLRAKLRRLLDVIEELQPQTWREGPFTILQRYLELTGQVLDMVAVGSTDAHRIVANIASFLRFAADWQAEHPDGNLGGFVDYLDAYQAAGGELPTSVELTEDVEGVRLMTLYQAKGLEFRHVFIPQLLTDEWPTREGFASSFPEELLRERIEGEEIHTQEERRLLYVAMTRAQDRLMLTTHGGPSAEKKASQFIGELLRARTRRSCASTARAPGNSRPMLTPRPMPPRPTARPPSCAG